MNVIVGSFTQLDFNHPQGFGLADEPAGVGDVVRVEDIYAFDPAPVALAAEDLGKLVGVQANVWTEQSRTENDVALITFPRAAALAEIAWSPYARQRWANFVDRLVSCVQRYDQLAIRHSDAAYRVSFALREVMPSGQVRVELSQQISSGEIRYTLDDSEPTARSPMYKDILNVRTPISMRAATFVNGEKISSTSRIELAKDSIAANGARN
jgi:hexosaminidase